MKKVTFSLIVLFTTVALIGCSNKGESITEPKFGTYKFTTYTIDTLRFRVILNDEVLTDSLLSPQSNFSRIVNFFNSTAKLKIVDANNPDQVIVDSVIQMEIGNTTFSIVQFSPGQKPTLPSIPNEPAPAAGNYKMRFQYIQPITPSVPFFDSIQCIVRENGNPIDTIILEQNELSPFYEGTTGGSSFTLKLQDTDGNPLHTSAMNGIGSGYIGFNTAVFYGSSGNNTNYRFTLKYAY